VGAKLMGAGVSLSSHELARVRSFLADQALPFWSSEGHYDNGCFVEQLDLQGTPHDPGFTRVRVQARQVYVFCHAHHSGLVDAAETCRKGVEFLIRSAWLGRDGGWARRLDRHGAVLDDRYDFYDVSFALFALGWYYRISGDPRSLSLAHQTIDFLERRAAHPAGGFDHDWLGVPPRQQNPHMHFVEALNVWLEATGDERFGAHAERILSLFETRFVDRSGALYEIFDDRWGRFDGPAGDVVEPGHQFEWAWIIGHNGRLSRRPRHQLMGQLLKSAIRAGYDPEIGVTVDQVDGRGRVIRASRRLWPQTEAIKGALAEAEFLGRDTSERVSLILSTLFARFLDPGPVPGSWIDHYDSDWTSIVDNVPASSLYHVTLAFLEMLRLSADKPCHVVVDLAATQTMERKP
jgi:mannose/cellobiose epimerase-like protein (N-acyl-D-glucosamine 2-epimerase family)